MMQVLWACLLSLPPVHMREWTWSELEVSGHDPTEDISDCSHVDQFILFPPCLSVSVGHATVHACCNTVALKIIVFTLSWSFLCFKININIYLFTLLFYPFFNSQSLAHPLRSLAHPQGAPPPSLRDAAGHTLCLARDVWESNRY